jgi:hypothetical protein
MARQERGLIFGSFCPCGFRVPSFGWIVPLTHGLNLVFAIAKSKPGRGGESGIERDQQLTLECPAWIFKVRRVAAQYGSL